ncbi:hypothetical protein JR316_0007070 [Psilocybe cubensis]|uniref:Uncharacterized protein n=1 Tax=Psilocybe cubensis TaxID=181762 RepID=A0ACB8GZU2_PSICU|nr:hypothetical protein JR316_0007070 [Psilocybe cubensis]KAH9480470.1 hypothetical protein JR316_0007070 [Psilocybe cubensis]
MDYDDYSLDERPSWGVVSPREGGGDLGVVRDTLRKEQVLNAFPNGQILSCNRFCSVAMLAKVQTVQKEVDKLVSGNETLQMYIDNLTVQMAKRR